MKPTITLAALFILLLVGCKENQVIDASEGFSIKLGNSTVLNHHDIDFYDISAHLIYLKSSNPVLNDIEGGEFSVFADNTEIYSGTILPMHSSYLPPGPVIRVAPSFYGDHIIPIAFNQFMGSEGSTIVDRRADARIIAALKKHGQYRAGLTSEISSITFSGPNQVNLNLRLTNNDDENLYYLDPGKTGINLFHYFTNGLIISDLDNHTYTHHVSVTSPEPWDVWESGWLSVINSKESKTISITYNGFDAIASGQYSARFSFPGLGHQVAKKDVQQGNGRIWLGELALAKDIVLK